jgi:hypothetical protein
MPAVPARTWTPITFLYKQIESYIHFDVNTARIGDWGLRSRSALALSGEPIVQWSKDTSSDSSGRSRDLTMR